MLRCILKFLANIFNKLSKGVHFFVRLNDVVVFNYKIKSCNSLKFIFQKICPHNHLRTFQFKEKYFFGRLLEFES